MNIKRITLVGVTVVAMLIFAGVAVAQGGPDNRPPQFPDGDILRELMDIVATEIGLEPPVIMQQWRDGATLAEVIESNGGDANAITEQVIALVSERLAEAVADGRITQERADTIQANLGERVAAILSGEAPSVPRPGGQDGRNQRPVVDQIVRHLRDALVDQTGLELEAIIEQLQGGASVADVLDSAGVDAEEFVAGVVTEIEIEITNAVAEGRITQEQADAVLENLGERVADALHRDGGLLPPHSGVAQMPDEQLYGMLIGMASNQTGLQPDAIMEQLRGGASLSSILNSAGVDMVAFTAGAITQATGGVQEQIVRMLNREGLPPQPDVVNQVRERLFGIVHDALIEQVGLEPETLMERLHSGESIAEILAESGVNLETFAASVIAQVETDVAAALAEGRITQEQAGRVLENLHDRVNELLNHQRDAGNN